MPKAKKSRWRSPSLQGHVFPRPEARPALPEGKGGSPGALLRTCLAGRQARLWWAWLRMVVRILAGWSAEVDGESRIGCSGPLGDVGAGVVSVLLGGAQDAGDDAVSVGARPPARLFVGLEVVPSSVRPRPGTSRSGSHQICETSSEPEPKRNKSPRQRSSAVQCMTTSTGPRPVEPVVAPSWPTTGATDHREPS